MPHLTPPARAEIEARLAREAAALRANLQRRKAQQRARQVPDPTPPPAPDQPACP